LHPAGRFFNRPLRTEQQGSGSADEIDAQLAKLPHSRAATKRRLQPAVTGETAVAARKKIKILKYKECAD